MFFIIYLKPVFYILFTAVLLCSCKNPDDKVYYWDYQLIERPAIVEGQIINYNAPVGQPIGKIILNPTIEPEQIIHEFEIDEQGHFRIGFPIFHPQEVMIGLPHIFTTIYVSPGKLTKFFYDFLSAQDFSKTEQEQRILKRVPLNFTGDMAQINNHYHELLPQLNGIVSWINNKVQVKSLKPHTYLEWRKEKMMEQLRLISEYNESENTPSDFRVFMQNHIRYYCYEDLLRYAWLHPDNKGTIDSIVPLDDAYISFVNEENLNNPNGLLTEYFGRFIREMDAIFQDRSPYKYAEILDALIKDNKLDSMEKAIMQQAIDFQKNLDNVSLDKLKPEIRIIYRKYNLTLQNYYQSRYLQRKIKFGMDTLPPGLGRDISIGRGFIQIINGWNQIIADNLLSDGLKNVDHRFIKHYITAQNNAALSNVKDQSGASAMTINPTTRIENSFDSLLQKYSGKVIYLDFWAPWCSPCMAEMEPSKIIQKEIQNDDLIFLFYAVNCSKESWQSTIKKKNLKGEHFWSTGEQYNEVAKDFESGGIPRYMLINREGDIVNSNAPRPSQKEELLIEIEKPLK